jgi:hypothetical protein
MTYSEGPRLNATNNPGGARWCDQPNHKRLECAKSRRRGRGVCHGPAIRGTDACKVHGGVSRAVAKAKGESRINAWSAIGAPPESGSIDAGMAVLGMLQMSWLRAAAYAELLRRQVVEEGGESGALEEDAPEASGLIGFRYGAAGKDGTIYATNEEVRALVNLESAERDRVVKFAKTAHDMGISDRITSLAEKWGDLVINRIVTLLAELELTPEQEALVPGLIQLHLGQIDVGAMGSEK